MSRYRSYGNLDDPFISEGDTFFTRMNARLRPSQLQAGEVALSQNGRMSEDGTWQPRKGLQTLSGAITVDAAALRLPYPIASAQRNSGVVTLNLFDIPSVAFEPGDQITIDGLVGLNGTHNITEVFYSNKQIQFSQAGANESFTGTADSIVAPANIIPTALSFTLTDEAANEVFGATAYSDPLSDFTDDYIFTATNNVMQIFRLRDGVEYKVRYPVGESIYQRCSLIQANNKIYVHRGVQTPLECQPVLSQLTIASAVRNNKTITITTAGPHSFTADQFVTLVGLGDYSLGGNPNSYYQVQNPTSNTFEVTFATNDTGTETYIASGSRVEWFNDFSLVKNVVDDGPYSLPARITDVGASVDGSVVTFNEPAHGFEVGDELIIANTASTYAERIGDRVRVTEVPDVDSFKFIMRGVDSASTAISLTTKQPVSFLRYMPAAPFAVENQRRLWMPYFYEEDYGTTPTSWKARTGKDEIIASDTLDSDSFDVIGNQFKVTGGSNDFIVGIQPFTEDRLLIMCRRSIHQLVGASGSLADVRINVVAPNLGCAARKTVVQVGNQVLFLSDKGVFSVSFLDEYNLRGDKVPLSEPIQPYIDQINQRFIDRAVATYFDNRYWLAVPTGAESENNLLFVYNFINEGWESIDRVDSLEFNIRDMVVAREGQENRLYVTTSEGGVHKIDGFDGGDQVSVSAGVNVPETIPVQSKLITRQYDCDTIERKVFSQSEVHMKSQVDGISDAKIIYETTDPDQSQSAQVVSDLLGSQIPFNEDASIRSRIRLRGYGCSAVIQPTEGRPYVRAVKVEGRVTDRSTTSTT
jgi:hypothetical protein